MNKSRVRGRIVAVLVMTVAFALLAAPAWALTGIPNHAMYAGPKGTVDLFGMTDDQVKAEVTSVTPEPKLEKLTLKANGRTLGPFWIKGVVWVDKGAILNAAKSTSLGTTFTVKPIYAVNSAKIGVWVNNLNKLSYTGPKNATFKVSGGKVVITPAKNGYAVNKGKTAALIVSRLKWKASAWPQVTDAGTLWATLGVFKPKIVAAHFAKIKTIIVILSKRTVTLYTGDKVTKSFRCAIGRPAYPTPTGVMTVYRKNPRPTWTNPGSAWAANMPSFIGAGPTNPLGLRALYLKNSRGVDQGIRIHGTYNSASIGTAASHGCIRLTNSNVVKLYPLVPIGTKVHIIR